MDYLLTTRHSYQKRGNSYVILPPHLPPLNAAPYPWPPCKQPLLCGPTHHSPVVDSRSSPLASTQWITAPHLGPCLIRRNIMFWHHTLHSTSLAKEQACNNSGDCSVACRVQPSSPSFDCKKTLPSIHSSHCKHKSTIERGCVCVCVCVSNLVLLTKYSKYVFYFCVWAVLIVSFLLLSQEPASLVLSCLSAGRKTTGSNWEWVEPRRHKGKRDKAHSMETIMKWV